MLNLYQIPPTDTISLVSDDIRPKQLALLSTIGTASIRFAAFKENWKNMSLNRVELGEARVRGNRYEEFGFPPRVFSFTEEIIYF